MIKRLKVPAHVLAFVASIWAYWGFTFERSIGSVVTLGILVYVILANLQRREILPSLGILSVFSSLNYLSHAVVYYAVGWDFSAAPWVLTIEVVGYTAFSYLLFKYHCADRLLSLVGADIRRAFIPQAVAVSIILVLSAVPFLFALGEVALYHLGVVVKVPFFYRNYELFKSISHTLIMLGIWSMMLDAHYLKERLSRKIAA